MSTLEQMVEKIFQNHHYVYNKNLIRNIAQYIEMRNAVRKEDEPIYTPAKWYEETRESNPETFVTQEDVMSRVADYFVKQRDLCIDQTGCLPCYEDFALTFECDDFKDYVGEWADFVDFNGFLNYLLWHYEMTKDIDV